MRWRAFAGQVAVKKAAASLDQNEWSEFALPFAEDIDR
jgi:hypothetical protein